MTDYRTRPATIADIEALVAHRDRHVHRHGRGDRRRLNASDFGRPLYETLGYQVWPQPMMIASLDA